MVLKCCVHRGHRGCWERRVLFGQVGSVGGGSAFPGSMQEASPQSELFLLKLFCLIEASGKSLQSGGSDRIAHGLKCGSPAGTGAGLESLRAESHSGTTALPFTECRPPSRGPVLVVLA